MIYIPPVINYCGGCGGVSSCGGGGVGGIVVYVHKWRGRRRERKTEREGGEENHQVTVLPFVLTGGLRFSSSPKENK